MGGANLDEKVDLLSRFLLSESEKEENEGLTYSRGGSESISFRGTVEISKLFIDRKRCREAYMNLREAAIHLNGIKFGLSRSDWTPHDQPSKLLSQLKSRGPMLVFGRFGEACYGEKPFQLSSQYLGERVWGWKPGTGRASEQQIRAVLMIGAWIEKEKSRVFFVNPQVDVKERKVYVISYRNFEENVTNVRAQLFSEIKEGDFRLISHFSSTRIGWDEILKILNMAPKEHPDVEYDKYCVSTYGFQK